MARERTIYEEDLQGNVIRVKARPQRIDRTPKDFDSTMRDNLYRMECEGARFDRGEKRWLRQASWFNQ